MRKRLIAVAAAAVSAVCGASAQEMYLSLTGSVQGEIKGSATKKGREDQIPVFDVSHSMKRTQVGPSARASGLKDFSPLEVVLPIDQATPLLMSMFNNNENVSSFRLDMLAKNETGVLANYYRIELEDAQISGLDFSVSATGEDVLTVAFAYRALTSTYVDGGVTVELSR